MSDKYYRGLKSTIDDVKNKLQLATMTLKINENKNSISGIKSDISGINNFSDKINDNETNISSNLSKINNNDNDIDEIRSNLNNIKNELSDFEINYSIQNLFLFDIDVEQNYTLNKENPEFIIFSYDLKDNFKSNVILEFNCKILYNYNSYNSIGHLTHIYKLYDENNKLIYESEFLKANAGDNLSAYLNQNDLFYVKLNNNYTILKIKLFISIIDKNKTVTCKLLNTFKSNFLVIKLYKKINTLSVNNNLTDLQNDILSNLSKINNNSADISSNLGKINTNINAIKLINENSQDNSADISSNLGKINANVSNISTNLSKINNNSSDISSNLIKINSNEDDILYNLSEINNIKNNISKSYLKNIYNVLFYDEKTQISFRNLFYEKVFDVDASINDFIEMDFKMLLEYENINEKIYVNTVYEILDENNNSLYISTINNNDYKYFSNKVTIKENIFYNFIKNVKNIKIRIKFVMTTTRVIKIWYIKNDNNRLILKHYGN